MVPQWYCTGTCSPVGEEIGVQSCDQADADLYCQLLKGDPGASASEWKQSSVLAEPGFCCLDLDRKTIDLGPFPDFGIDALCYQDTDMLDNHGLGYAILREEITCD